MESTGLNPERGIKVTMMLADHAQVADGKLNLIGGGWDVTGPQPGPFAIAAKVDVSWHLTNRQHALQFELIDIDGNAVVVETPEGEQPVRFEGTFEVGRPPGVRTGTSLPFMFAMNSGPLPLEPGRHFEWRLMINGETHEDWRLPFSTRPAPGQEQTRAA
jgi:hypothetical protein